MTPAPLCGSDGKTHFNKCHFLRLKCRVDAAAKEAAATAAVDMESVVNNGTEADAANPEPKKLFIRHGGKCGRFMDASDARVHQCVAQCGAKDEDHVIKPVCASDGKTYPNFCFYLQAKCLAYINRQVDINFLRVGFCEK